MSDWRQRIAELRNELAPTVVDALHKERTEASQDSDALFRCRTLLAAVLHSSMNFEPAAYEELLERIRKELNG